MPEPSSRSLGPGRFAPRMRRWPTATVLAGRTGSAMTREMAKLFLLVGQRQKKNSGPVPTFFQSHPDPKSRHDAIMKLYAERQQAAPNNALYVGKENLRQRFARSRRKFPE